MLLRIAISNFRSIAEEQQLLLTASKLRDGGVDLIESEALNNVSVLPALIIYGANASGKSAILKGLKWMVEQVSISHTNRSHRDPIVRYPHALGEIWKQIPSLHEVDFICEGVRYNYGFEANDYEYTREWLFSWPKGTKVKLFERDRKAISFSRHLRGRNTVISDLTRHNSLFLSAAAQNNHETLRIVSSYLQSISFEIGNDLHSAAAVVEIGANNNWKVEEKVLEFLRKSGTGVQSYRLKDDAEEESANQRKFGQAIVAAMSDLTGREMTVPDMLYNMRQIELGHLGEDGQEFYLPIQQESSGTVRLLIALPKVYRALSTGGVVVIDELDLSLHTRAADLIVGLFSQKSTNPEGAQLIATTHDTNLLVSQYLRRDQIWFVEKGNEGKSQLYPLTDIATRKTDNIERGYLQGRFGAVPFEGVSAGEF